MRVNTDLQNTWLGGTPVCTGLSCNYH